MCTVSFIKSGSKFIITSNRDEKTIRPVALKPQQYCINNKRITFPKDVKAGGTWFAVDEHANVAVLLNGALVNHTEKEKYTRSRGLILLDIISTEFPLQQWQNISLTGIEPFTIILFEKGKLFQIQWDETTKHTLALNENDSYIWSSVTLYTDEIRREREEWFTEFTTTRKNITAEDLQHFHMNNNSNNTENGLVINRNNIVKTFSVSQTVIEINKVNLFHFDLHSKEEFNSSFLII